MSLSDARNRLAFPLDYPNLAEARRGAELVRASAGVLKVGLELFVKEGPAAVAVGRELGCEIFLDLKLHDIPATVDAAVASAASLGVRYLTVHASGGPAMVTAAVKRAAREDPDLVVAAVTVLTSLDGADLAAVGLSSSPGEQALRLARMAADAGARGFVCSPSEVAELRAVLGPEAILITPGIRPGDAAAGDQKRTGTPGGAIRNGATILVVGRPIREAPDPAAAAANIVREIAAAAATPHES